MKNLKIKLSRDGLSQVRIYDMCANEEFNEIFCSGMIRSFNKDVTGDVRICLLLKNRKGNVLRATEGKIFGKIEKSASPFEIRTNEVSHFMTEIDYIELMAYEKNEEVPLTEINVGKRVLTFT